MSNILTSAGLALAGKSGMSLETVVGLLQDAVAHQVVAGNGHNLVEVAKATSGFVAECDEALVAAPKGAAKTAAKVSLAYAKVVALAFANAEQAALAARQEQVRSFPPVKGEKPSAEARASAGSHASAIVDAFRASIDAYEQSLAEAREEKGSKREESRLLREQQKAEDAAQAAIAAEKMLVVIKSTSLEQAVESACAALGRDAVIALLLQAVSKKAA